MVNRTQTVWKAHVVELHVYNGTTYIQIWRPGRYLKPTLFAADEYMGNNHKKNCDNTYLEKEMRMRLKKAIWESKL